jgi:hypothetical protein
MTTLAVNQIAVGGSAITYATPTASVGDDAVVADDQRHALVVKNGSGASINVTMTAQTTQAQQAGAGLQPVANKVLAVAAGADAWIPILPDFIRANDGKVQFVCSAVTTILVAVVKLPRHS